MGLPCFHTAEAIVLPSCHAKLSARTSGAREQLSGHRFAGVGRLKHIDVILCWLQDAWTSKVLAYLPISTTVSLSDLNTRKLPAARRRFFHSILEAVRLHDQNRVFESIGVQQKRYFFANELSKQQINRVTRWVKNKASVRMVQCALTPGDAHERDVEQNGVGTSEGEAQIQFARRALAKCCALVAKEENDNAHMPNCHQAKARGGFTTASTPTTSIVRGECWNQRQYFFES